MSDEIGPGPDTSVTLPADAPETFDSPSSAASYFAELRYKQRNESAESAPPATAEHESAGEAEVSPETVPDQIEAHDQADETLPPVEPPRSWTKEEKERWNTFPREAQEALARIEQGREREFLRRQNEFAEERKAVQAQRDAAEKARQQYEAQIPALMQELQNVQQNAFSDIKSMDDVVRLQADDPFRFQAWQVHQMRLQAAKQEADRIEGEKRTKEQTDWMNYIQEQDAKALELIPELSDETKGKALRDRVVKEVLPGLGFTQGELNELASGKSKLSIYDARIQRLLADSLTLRDIRNAPKAVAAKPLPPVQKPGVRQTGNANAERIQALTRQLNETGDLKIAQELNALRQQSRRAS